MDEEYSIRLGNALVIETQSPHEYEEVKRANRPATLCNWANLGATMELEVRQSWTRQ
jgi:hypothetical protein